MPHGIHHRNRNVLVTQPGINTGVSAPPSRIPANVFQQHGPLLHLDPSQKVIELAGFIAGKEGDMVRISVGREQTLKVYRDYSNEIEVNRFHTMTSLDETYSGPKLVKLRYTEQLHKWMVIV